MLSSVSSSPPGLRAIAGMSVTCAPDSSLQHKVLMRHDPQSASYQRYFRRGQQREEMRKKRRRGGHHNDAAYNAARQKGTRKVNHGWCFEAEKVHPMTNRDIFDASPGPRNNSSGQSTPHFTRPLRMFCSSSARCAIFRNSFSSASACFAHRSRTAATSV